MEEQPQAEAKEVTPQEAFLNEYNALVERTGLAFHYRIESPLKEDGTFDTTLHKVVAYLDKKV